MAWHARLHACRTCRLNRKRGRRQLGLGNFRLSTGRDWWQLKVGNLSVCRIVFRAHSSFQMVYTLFNFCTPIWWVFFQNWQMSRFYNETRNMPKLFHAVIKRNGTQLGPHAGPERPIYVVRSFRMQSVIITCFPNRNSFLSQFHWKSWIEADRCEVLWSSLRKHSERSCNIPIDYNIQGQWLSG